MTPDCGVVAENFVFHDVLARAHGVEEIGQVIRLVVITKGKSKHFCFVLNFKRAALGQGVFSLPLRLVLLTQFPGPAINGVVIHLVAGSLWLVGQLIVVDHHRSILAIEPEKLPFEALLLLQRRTTLNFG